MPTRMHNCAAHGCSEAIYATHIFCRDHYWRVPDYLLRRIEICTEVRSREKALNEALEILKAKDEKRKASSEQIA